MLSMEERLERLEYYQSLLLEMIDEKKKPFYALVLKARLSKDEVEKVFKICEKLSIEYEKQKAEGFVIFTSLLNEFIGVLNGKLPISQTIEGMIEQNLFIPLMVEFKKIYRNV